MKKVHKEDFDALRNPEYGNFALVETTVNGEESAAICVVRDNGDGTVDLFPVFVAVTPGMKLIGPEGKEPEVALVGPWKKVTEKIPFGYRLSARDPL